MFTQADLESAVAAGALTPDAAAAFRAHLDARTPASSVDEEQFRLITGFNDIFVSIAAILFLTGCAWAGSSIVLWLGAALVSAAAWGMAEFFTARRRMALPSILLLIAFVAGLFATVITLLAPSGYVSGDDIHGKWIVAGAAAVSALGAWAHWRRFQVPITVAAGAAALTGLVFAILAALFPAIEQHILLLLFAAGVALFATAMWWDMSDLERRTRRSDVAFWLHLLAAPMMVHPIFSALGVMENAPPMATGLLVILLYIGLGAIALVIDRRALMVSALAYVLAALGAVLREFGALSLDVAITALVIGSALLLLSAFWHSVRAALIGWLPPALQARLPPVQSASPQPAS
ncbi:MAG: hypothetical protein ACKOXK_02250 [Chakrabartia sp.]